MSTNTLQAPPFRETQYMRQWWVLLIVAWVAVLCWAGFVVQILFGYAFGNNPAPDIVVWLIWACGGVAFPLFLLSCHLKTEVNDEHVLIHWFPLYRRRLPFGEIASAEAITYRPVLDYGGWGIRWGGRRGWAYNVSGNRGVQLVLHNGQRLLIGSNHADDLAQAILQRLPAQSAAGS